MKMNRATAINNRTNLEFSNDQLWYKDAIIYQLHVKSFFDSNHDGIGDFKGLIEKLDYISQLGVNTIWLLPFYPSPRKDDGYDISSYRDVSPDYGSLSDAKRFIEKAHALGLRVVTELIVNHTSDQHPWFQKARHAKPGSAARDFYVWSDTDTKYNQTRIIFPDFEKSNWTWDPVANAFYWHRFFSHQPDLNFDNPNVLKKILEVMRFWLDIGVDGLRLDAIPYLIEREGTSNENLPETHLILKTLRKVIDEEYSDRMLLAEANMWPEDVQTYFGDNDECHMAFHFPLMPRMYLALAQEDRFPISDILRQTPDIHPNCQWAIFLRNHDELTLEMVSENERAYMLNFYAAESKARLNVGIRRRLAPLLQRDRRRLELLNSLLLSMPGTPIIYYGDEIGMGDNIHLGDRDGVRTPMQWSPDRNGGFSTVDPAKLVLPANMDTHYGYQSINVESQTSDPHSLLNWTKKLLHVRKQFKVFGRGALKLLYPDNRKILAYLRHFSSHNEVGQGGEIILCIANVSSSAQAVELDLSDYAGFTPVELLGGSIFPAIKTSSYVLSLAPYAFYWFQLLPSLKMEKEVPKKLSLPELRTLVLKNDIHDLMQPGIRETIEQEILPSYLPLQLWFTEKMDHDGKISFALLESPHSTANGDFLLLTIFKTPQKGDVEQAYFLPLGVCLNFEDASARSEMLALARIRRGPKIGLLTDALTIKNDALHILDLVRNNANLNSQGIKFEFESINLPVIQQSPIEIRELPNSTTGAIIVGDQLIIKVLHRIRPGINAFLDISRHLNSLHYPNAAEVFGQLNLVFDNGISSTQIIVQQYIHNQGTGWDWTLDRLKRAVQQNASEDIAINVLPMVDASPLDELSQFASLLGKRLAELHNALSLPSDDPAFSPGLAGKEDVGDWIEQSTARLESAFDLIQQHDWDGSVRRESVDSLMKLKPKILRYLKSHTEIFLGKTLIRTHGNLNLENILMISGDLVFTGFGSRTDQTVEHQLKKTSPLQDVAHILRSFQYAADYIIQSSISGQLAENLQKIDDYLSVTTRCFIHNYLETVSGENLLNTSLGHIDELVLSMEEESALNFFMLEKLLAEIIHEAIQRPAWLIIPVLRLNTLLKTMEIMK